MVWKIDRTIYKRAYIFWPLLCSKIMDPKCFSCFALHLFNLIRIFNFNIILFSFFVIKIILSLGVLEWNVTDHSYTHILIDRKIGVRASNFIIGHCTQLPSFYWVFIKKNYKILILIFLLIIKYLQRGSLLRTRTGSAVVDAGSIMTTASGQWQWPRTGNNDADGPVTTAIVDRRWLRLRSGGSGNIGVLMLSVQGVWANKRWHGNWHDSIKKDCFENQEQYIILHQRSGNIGDTCENSSSSKKKKKCIIIVTHSVVREAHVLPHKTFNLNYSWLLAI